MSNCLLFPVATVRRHKLPPLKTVCVGFVFVCLLLVFAVETHPYTGISQKHVRDTSHANGADAHRMSNHQFILILGMCWCLWDVYLVMFAVTGAHFLIHSPFKQNDRVKYVGRKEMCTFCSCLFYLYRRVAAFPADSEMMHVPCFTVTHALF